MVSGADRFTPLQQLREIRKYLHQELQVVEFTLSEILKKLEKEGIFLKTYDEVNQQQKYELNRYFTEQIYPVIVPIAVDSTHPFPHLNNLSFGLIIKLKDLDDETIERNGIVRIPRVLPRFVELENGIYVPVESVVARHIS
jgi:polyphosphate kinase